MPGRSAYWQYGRRVSATPISCGHTVFSRRPLHPMITGSSAQRGERTSRWFTSRFTQSRGSVTAASPSAAPAAESSVRVTSRIGRASPAPTPAGYSDGRTARRDIPMSAISWNHAPMRSVGVRRRIKYRPCTSAQCQYLSKLHRSGNQDPTLTPHPSVNLCRFIGKLVGAGSDADIWLRLYTPVLSRHPWSGPARRPKFGRRSNPLSRQLRVPT